MRRIFFSLLVVLSTPVLAINCEDIWSAAIRSNSPQPATISYPAAANPLTSNPVPPNDYYYSESRDWLIENNTVLTTSGATTRLFINGNLTIGNNSVLNSGGAPENFILVVSGSLVLNNNVVINGFVLAGGAVQLNNNAVVNGAVTAKGAVANAGTVNFQPAAIPALAGGSLCGELLAIDDFESYPTGSIIGQNGGAGWNGAWAGTASRQQIADTSANRLRYTAANDEFIAGGTRALVLSGSSATAATRFISSRRADDVVYVSMLVRFDIASGNNLFASLWFDQTGFSNVPNIGLKSNRGTGGGAEDIMVRTRTNNDVYSTPIVNGETYLIVGRLAKTTPGVNQPYDQWQLWVNPATLSDQPASPDVSTVGASDVVSFREIGFRTENLSASDQVIIDRMAIGKTWQEVVTPSPPEFICLADTFSDAALSDTWVTARSNGSFTPQVVNGRLRMTEAVRNQATSATYQRLYPAADNLVIVEFDYRAYGGSGADGLAVVLSDATVTPQPGSFGGPLGYGYKPGIPGFAGGWLGFGLDEFGNFSNEGGAASKGRRQQSVVVRGSGEGTTGYRYLRGTCNNGATNPAGGCLNPRVDGNETSPHRYRFTVDSRTPGTTMVSVERNHGTGFITLIAPFNARTEPAQAAVPENFFLSLTGSTGGSTNIHELDNLSICALRSTPVGRQIDHFEFDYSGQALTCKPETLTVRACANASCNQLITDPVRATLSPATVTNGGWVGGNVLNFSGGTTTVDLRRNVAGSTLIGISGSVPATRPLSQTLCRAGASALSTAACNINFASAGLVFNVPDGIANQPATNITVAAVRQSDVSQQCVPQFSNVSRNVNFWSNYINPDAASRPVSIPVQVNGDNIGQTATSTVLPLNFDGNGEALINVNYADAGQVQLNARYTGNAANDDAGLVLNGSDQFIRRPAGLCIKNDGHCLTADASCPVFKRAGESFPLTISAHAWQDASTDICSNPVTPNFQQTNIGLSHTLQAPTGVPGTLGLVNYAHQRAVNGQTLVQQSVSEVGVFRFNTAPINYLSMTSPVPAASGQASGRFVPADFAVSDISSSAACGSFSYLQQPFALGFTLTARNTLGQRTRNYFGAFANSTLLLQAENADNGTDLTNRLTSSGFASWALGQQSFSTTELALNRQLSGVTDGPFLTLSIALNVVDDDGSLVANPDTNTGNIACASDNSCNAAALMLTDIRYGRLQMANGFGPEFDDLPVSLTAEYWDGSRFVTNTADNCSAINAANLSLSNSLTTASANAATISSGKTSPGGLLLLAPAASGTVEATYQVPVWLQYDWNDDGSYNNSPVAEFMFGRYRGNPRQIYWRERF